MTDGTAPRESGNNFARLAMLDAPEVRIYPDLPRTMDQVPDALQGVLRALAAGTARWPLYLHGGVGTGKTRAALCLCDYARSAAFYSHEQICGITMRGADDAKSILRQQLCRCALFIVDEIGERTEAGDLLHTTLKGILDDRESHQRRRGIFISNVSPDGIRQLFDRRVTSRLLSGTVFELRGRDRRAAA